MGPPALLWRIISVDNLFAGLIPGVLFTFSASWATGQPADRIPLALARSSLLAFLYIFTFSLSNQMENVEEDHINKPHRPIAAGEFSVRASRITLVAALAAYVVVGWWLGVVPWAIVWIVTSLAHNQLHLARYWVAKNAAMFIGTVCMMAESWQQVAPITALAWRWTLAISGVVFILIPLQDLRDTAGDTAVGRRTFPIALGERATRWFLCLGFAMLPEVIWLMLRIPAGLSARGSVAGIVMALLNFLTAYRVVRYRTARADHHTYLLFCWWFCVALATAGPLMRPG